MRSATCTGTNTCVILTRTCLLCSICLDVHNLCNKCVIGLRAIYFCVFRNDVILRVCRLRKEWQTLKNCLLLRRWCVFADVYSSRKRCERSRFESGWFVWGTILFNRPVSKKSHSSFVWCIVPSGHIRVSKRYSGVFNRGCSDIAKAFVVP